MRAVAAIARVSLQGALRSRLVVAMLGLLLLTVVVLPATIRGDGTLAGYTQVQIRYGLGAAGMILTVMTLWAAAAAVSLDVETRRVQTVVTKPVGPFTLWLGKWLGLCVMNAVLLAACGAVVFAMFLWKTREGPWDPDEARDFREHVRVARIPVSPDLAHLDRRIAEEEEAIRRDPEAPVDVRDARAVREVARQRAVARELFVAPDSEKSWRFEPPRRIRTDRPLVLRFRLAAARMSMEPVEGAFRVQAGPQTTDLIPVAAPPNRTTTLTLPPLSLAPGQPVTVTFVNRDQPAVFSAGEGLRLGVYETSFAVNYGRALLMMYVRLVFIAALGVTAGALFSFPVAAFVTGCLVFFVAMTAFVRTTPDAAHSHGGPPPEASPWEAFANRVAGAIHPVFVPLTDPDYLEMVSTGESVTWGLALRSLGFKIGVYGGLLALGATAVLRRRELGEARA